jgi:hypothetical protein
MSLKSELRRKYERDPMVPLSPRVLRDALKFNNMNIADLRRALGASTISHQRLAKILSGPDDRMKRCRQSLLRAMSKALGVPQRFLRGEPLILRSALDDWQAGYETDYSPLTALAAQAFYERCEEAYRRDLGDPQAPQMEPQYPDDYYVGEFRKVLRASLSIRRWRLDLLIRPGLPARSGQLAEPTPKEAKLISPPQESPEHEKAVLALIEVLSHILAPWIEGTAKLNYSAMIALANRGVQQVHPVRFSPVSSDDTSTETNPRILVKAVRMG